MLHFIEKIKELRDKFCVDCIDANDKGVEQNLLLTSPVLNSDASYYHNNNINAENMTTVIKNYVQGVHNNHNTRHNLHTNVMKRRLRGSIGSESSYGNGKESKGYRRRQYHHRRSRDDYDADGHDHDDYDMIDIDDDDYDYDEKIGDDDNIDDDDDDDDDDEFAVDDDFHYEDDWINFSSSYDVIVPPMSSSIPSSVSSSSLSTLQTKKNRATTTSTTNNNNHNNNSSNTDSDSNRGTSGQIAVSAAVLNHSVLLCAVVRQNYVESMADLMSKWFPCLFK